LKVLEGLFPHICITSRWNACKFQVRKEYLDFKPPGRAEKTRSFRKKYQLDAKILKKKYGFNFLRLGIPASWSTQSKAQVFHIVSLVKLFDDIRGVDKDFGEVLLGAYYVIAAIGENAPDASNWRTELSSELDYFQN
jgi:hypothetical protein